MIDLYLAPTPNAWKVTIMLEECGLAYRRVPVDIRNGEQDRADFRALFPNGKIPAIVDHRPAAGEAPIAIFESGAILIHLAEKTGHFLGTGAERLKVLQWVMWQMSALGPTLGQNGHFHLYAPEAVPYAQERFRTEALRLYGVLDAQLGRTKAYVAGDAYTIADMCCFPWAMTHKAQGFTLDDFPHVRSWYARLRERPSLQRGLTAGRDLSDLRS